MSCKTLWGLALLQAPLVPCSPLLTNLNVHQPFSSACLIGLHAVLSALRAFPISLLLVNSSFLYSSQLKGHFLTGIFWMP